MLLVVIQMFELALLYPSPVLGQCELSQHEVDSVVLATLCCGYRPRSVHQSMALLLIMGRRSGAP